MTLRLSNLASVEYSTETTFGEDTSTYATRLLTLGMIDLSGLKIGREQVGVTQQRPHEDVVGVRTFYDGSFTLEFLLTGHGGTTAGALTATELCTLLGHVVGAKRTADVGTTGAASGTATGLELAAGTFVAGSILRAGALGDGRGGGQAYRVGTVGSNPEATLLTAMPAALNNGDVVYAMQLVHPLETPGTCSTVQALRFRFLSPNEQYECHGCWANSLEFLNLNTVPRVKIGFRCAWWETANTTFPSTASTDAKAGAPVANGSMFLQTYGTTTRQTFNYQDLSIRIDLSCIPIEGPGAAIDRQKVIDVRRQRCQASVSATFPAEATGTQTLLDMYNADGYQHMLVTLSVTDGRALAFYFPRLAMQDDTPIQRDSGGLNRVMASWKALTNTVTTSDLTMANWVLAMG